MNDLNQLQEHLDRRLDKQDAATLVLSTKLDNLNTALYHPDEGAFARAKKAVHTANDALTGMHGIKATQDDHGIRLVKLEGDTKILMGGAKKSEKNWMEVTKLAVAGVFGVVSAWVMVKLGLKP